MLLGVCFANGVLLPSYAQEAPSALATATARQASEVEIELQQIRQLVSAGALPATRIAELEEKRADIADERILDSTLYGSMTVQDLSGEQSNEMLSAAQRRVDRQRAKVERLQKLASEGVIARNQSDAPEEELRVRESAYSLAQNRAQLFEELAATARTEASAENVLAKDAPLMERFDGAGRFNEEKDLKPLESAFKRKFAELLPISADGETAVHRAMGFDHRGRIDVAVSPDTPEGLWLRNYLEARKIPYFAFRAAIPGKATGAHIHIGPESTRFTHAD